MSEYINISVLPGLTFFIVHKSSWNKITNKPFDLTVPIAIYNFVVPRVKTRNVDILFERLCMPLVWKPFDGQNRWGTPKRSS